MDQEELYQSYQSKLARLEEEYEDYERKYCRWEEMVEEGRGERIQERAVVEEMLNHWGENSHSGVLLSDFEEAMEQYDQKIRMKEEAFCQERLRLQSEQSSCEAWYEEEKRNYEGGDECQES